MTDFADYFLYSEDSPSCLVWKVEIRSGHCGNRTMTQIGDVAGYCNLEGYWRVGVESREHTCHRIVWQLHYGEIPEGMQIDHINRDRSDNRVENLRLANKVLNMQNRSKQHSNTSGKTGVNWMFNGANDTYAVAQWSLGKDQHRGSKYFPVKKFGLLPAFHLACEYRKTVITKLNALGANYTETHGT